jgi:2-oxo-3-hexenedioate decarboxylase/2-keto-4-pentenoate hydratase
MLPDRQRPKDREEAYDIQDEMVRIIGRPTLGWKMGATSPAIKLREGHSGPIVGRVLAGTVFHSPTEIPAERFPNARIEAEFAVVLHDDFPPRQRPYGSADFVGKFAFHPSIEIIGNRYPKAPVPPKLNTFDEIADNGTGTGVVLGDPIMAATDFILQNLVIAMSVDGGPPAENVLGDDRCVAAAVLVETANILSKRGLGLHRGEFITTGGATSSLPVKKGSRFVAKYGDYSSITGTFV